MWPTSDAFNQQITRSHRRTIRVDVLEGSKLVASTGPMAPRQLRSAGGEVTATLGGDYRREGSVTFVSGDSSLVPFTGGDLLDPRSGRLWRPWRGIVLADGSIEEKPLGLFHVKQATVVEDRSAVSVAISGKDLMAKIVESRWRGTYRVADGSDLGAVLLDLATVYLGFEPATNFTAPSGTLTRQTYGVESTIGPGQAMHRMAESLGMWVYFDQMGTLTTTPIPNPDEQPSVWALVRNGSNLRIPQATRNIDGTTTRNGVIVTGNAPWLLYPVRGEVWDTDPDSPTYYDPDETDPDLIARMAAPNPEHVVSSSVGSDAAAQTMAEGLAPQTIGIEETAEFSMVPHSALAEGDAMDVQSDVYAGQTRRHVIRRLSVPFDAAGVSSISTRMRRS